MMNWMNKFKEFCQGRQNTKMSTKFAIEAIRALQTAEESAENLDNRLARFFVNCFWVGVKRGNGMAEWQKRKKG